MKYDEIINSLPKEFQDVLGALTKLYSEMDGTFNLSCKKEGDKISVSLSSTCEVSLPAIKEYMMSCVEAAMAEDLKKHEEKEAEDIGKEQEEGRPECEFEEIVPADGHHMVLEAFLDQVARGILTNEDGFGYWANADNVSNWKIWPSEVIHQDRGKFPDWATHVVWYNK